MPHPPFENRADRIPDADSLAQLREMEQALRESLEMMQENLPWVSVMGMLYNLRRRIDNTVRLPIDLNYRYASTSTLSEDDKARLLRETEIPEDGGFFQ